MSSFPLNDGSLQIFDVDHGQCALLSIPSFGKVYYVLIDCGHATNFKGGGPWYPGAHLQHLGINYIDLLVCTNYDEDHMSGYPDLERRGISIGCILGNPTVSPEAIVKLKTEDGKPNMGPGIEAIAITLAVRRQIGWRQVPPKIPGVNMIWTCNPYPGAFQDENNLSLIFTIDVHGFRFMFPGDMECPGFENLLRTCPEFRPVVAGVNVLNASHHGRESGICPDMFDIWGCRPKFVVISDCYKKHATQETTDYYGSKVRGLPNFRGELGVRKVLTTRTDHEIRFSFQNGRCDVH
jgi:beta-lactamase superfamily II metal-dependent hydrolase